VPEQSVAHLGVHEVRTAPTTVRVPRRVLVVGDDQALDAFALQAELERAGAWVERIPGQAGAAAAAASSGADTVVVLGEMADPMTCLGSEVEVVGSLMRLQRNSTMEVVRARVSSAALAVAVSSAEAAFGRVATLEDPDLVVRSIVLDPALGSAAVTALTGELGQAEEWVALDPAGRRTRTMAELATRTGHWPVLRAGDIVLLSGGAGELGVALAGDVGRGSGCQVVLLGRSDGDAERVRSAVAKLQEQAVRARYEQCDVADLDAVGALCERLRQQGRIRGVIHAAGRVDDGFVTTKDATVAQAVALPKVAGVLALDAATASDELAFFLATTSLAGVFPNVGQADYAYANAFVSEFVGHRNELVARGARHGVSSAVALPAVRGTVMTAQLGKATLDRSLDLGQAVAACRSCVSADGGLTVVLGPESEPTTAGSIAPGRLDGVEQVVLDVIRRVTKLGPDEATALTDFRKLGIESILALSLTAALEEHFGRLPKTLFFEHNTPRELAQRIASRLPGLADAQVAVSGAAQPDQLGAEVRTATPAKQASDGGEVPTKWALLAARGRAEGGGTGTSTPAGVPEPIAVVGIAGSYPQAPDLETFWANLRDGVDAITEVPGSRWEHDRIFDPTGARPGSTRSRWGGFLDGIEHFDPLFFGVSPAEANYMDPQERLFLQTAWHAVEEAGYDPRAFEGHDVGVFVGAMFSHYQLLSGPGGVRGGASFASIANRVSWTLGLRGPSVAVDTMCSSSLTALHWACRSIRARECSAAIVGGVNVMPHPAKFVTLAQAGFLSSDGRCRSFGADGDGYVPSEGVGAVVLKPLSEALAHGDHVHAVIRGSAVNAAGRTNGYTVPSPVAEGDVIAKALEESRTRSGSVSYVEAHGTGTALGDPIEVVGLAHALTPRPEAPVWLGSVKSSIGHAESAAGIAALTKVVLQLRHRTVAPSLHSAQVNPHLDLESSGFRVPQQAVDWLPVEEGAPLVAGVSAFGAGGSNAHVVVVEAPSQTMDDDADAGAQLVVLSAPDEERLEAVVEAWRAWLTTESRADIPNVASAVEQTLGLPEGSVGLLDRAKDIGLDAVSWERVLSAVGLPHLPMGEELLAEIQAQIPAPPAPRVGMPTLTQIAATSQLGRTAHARRMAVLAHSHEELVEALTAAAEHRDHPSLIMPPAAGTPDVTAMLGAAFTTGFMSDAVAHRRWADAARVWVAGAAADWEPAWQDRRPVRASLPLYPFRKDVCWLTPLEPGRPLASMEELPTMAVPVPVPEPEVAADAAVPDLVLNAFSAVLGISRDRLKLEESLSSYGVDSIRVRQLLGELEHTLPGIPVSVMFNAETVADVVDAAEKAHASGVISVAQRQISPPAEATADEQAIAVVGMAGRFPGAPDVNSLAQRLRAGDDLIGEVPIHRWDWRHFEGHQVRWGGFMQDERCFDADFFGIAPSTAAYMDPQERILLECAWQCVGDAGYVPPTLAQSGQRGLTRSTGVFVGVSFKDYALHGAQDLARGLLVPVDTQQYSAANRVSYHLGLRGPSIAMDTACSSSLTALHQACNALRMGQVDAALAGGSNLLLHPAKMMTLSAFGFMADDGHCHSFGDGGNGYAPADGVGVVLLKRLSDALRDSDHIHGVVRGSALNHGGQVRGYTMPSPQAQAELVQAALASACVAAPTISVIEAHGTGTDLGDPIEVEALASVFSDAPRHEIALGSVKGNMGHAEAAAGVAQVIKVLLELRDGMVYPSRTNSERVNPLLNLAESPFHIPTQLAGWDRPERGGARLPRRAAVSSFGAGGANAHVVIEEAPEVVGEQPLPPRHELVVLSARDDGSLRRLAGSLAGALGAAPQGVLTLADVATTLRLGRPALGVRLAIVTDDLQTLRTRLEAFADDDVREGMRVGSPDEVTSPAVVDLAVDSDLAFVADAWVDGRVLWGDGWTTGRMVSLPTYEFERSEHWLYSGEASSARDEATEAAPHQHGMLSARLAGCTPREREEVIEDEVRGLLAKHLGFDDPTSISADKGFFDLGVDSISSTELVRALQDEADHLLDPQMFFTYPTIARLTRYLAEELSPEEDAEPAPDLAVEPPSEMPLVMVAPEWLDKAGGGSDGQCEVLLLVTMNEAVASAIKELPQDIRPRRTITVTLGDVQEKLAEDDYTIRAGDAQGLEWVLGQLGESITHALLWLGGGRESSDELLVNGFYTAMALCKALAAAQPGGRVGLLFGYKTSRGGTTASSAAMTGLVHTIRQEMPDLVAKSLEITQPNLPWSQVAATLVHELTSSGDDLDVRAGGSREVKGFVGVAPQGADNAFRHGGCYLITGGAGGLGSLFAREIAGRHQAHLVLLGRKPASEATEQLLEQIRDLGGSGEYRELDVADEAAVRVCVQDVVARRGALHGIIHCAGLTRDSSMVSKSPEDVAVVLAPKVAGTRALLAAVEGMDLDMFVGMSSLAGVLGNFGQSDYAFANAYLDQSMVLRGSGTAGRTVSISWSFWEGIGGLPTTDGIKTWMRERVGVEPLVAEDAWPALEWALTCGRSHVLITKGDVEKLSNLFATDVLPLTAGRSTPDVEPGQRTSTGHHSEAAPLLDTMTEEDLVELLRIEIESATQQPGKDS